MPFFRVTVSLLTIAVVCSLAPAGVGETVELTLRSGETVSGKVLQETKYKYIIEVTISNISFEKTIAKSDVTGVEEIEPLTEEELESLRDQLSSNENDRDDDTTEWIRPTRYIVIPIHEAIGIESLRDDPLTVTADGIRDVIQFAVQKKIKHVVFSLDTPGGFGHEADLIAETIKDYSDEITFHALVRRSISAGMWITYACDHIWFLPGSSAGGALSWIPTDSGTPEYDAKINSVNAAELASLAKTHGHNPAIASAMVLPEKEVYTWLGENGQHVITDHAPDGVNATQVDGPATVLTLTRDLAVQLGVGKVVESGHESIGEIIGAPRWTKTGNRYARNVLSRATKEIIDSERTRRERYVAMIKSVEQSVSALPAVQNTISSAMRADPKKFSYTYKTQTGELTAASKREWRRNTDNAIRLWNQVLSQISNIVDKRNGTSRLLNKHHETPVYFSFESDHEAQGEQLRNSLNLLEQYGTQLNAWRNQAENNISRLRAERNKRYF